MDSHKTALGYPRGVSHGSAVSDDMIGQTKEEVEEEERASLL